MSWGKGSPRTEKGIHIPHELGGKKKGGDPAITSRARKTFRKAAPPSEGHLGFQSRTQSDGE